MKSRLERERMTGRWKFIHQRDDFGRAISKSTRMIHPNKNIYKLRTLYYNSQVRLITTTKYNFRFENNEENKCLKSLNSAVALYYLKHKSRNYEVESMGVIKCHPKVK